MGRQAGSGEFFQGQSQTETVIKLIDNAPSHTDPAVPKEVIWTGRQPAQRFTTQFGNLTVDTGYGNAGAVGSLPITKGAHSMSQYVPAMVKE